MDVNGMQRMEEGEMTSCWGWEQGRGRVAAAIISSSYRSAHQSTRDEGNCKCMYVCVSVGVTAGDVCQVMECVPPAVSLHNPPPRSNNPLSSANFFPVAGLDW